MAVVQAGEPFAVEIKAEVEFQNDADQQFQTKVKNFQVVASDDSVLGGLANNDGVDNARGLSTAYHDMIEAAFEDEFTSDDLVPDGSGFSQKEANMSLFWGLAVMLYDSGPAFQEDTHYLKGPLLGS